MAWWMVLTAAVAAEPVAVLELYTSQGCSSCPAADALLAEYVARADAEGTAVYPLSFHVDYWDDLGWPDPFADAAWTSRQRAYGGAFRARSVYTPQLVVNGTVDVVGSHRAEVGRAVEAALAEPAAVGLDLEATWAPDGVRAAWTTRGVAERLDLHVAVVERGLSRAVARGENRGRTLAHEHVVRALHTVVIATDRAGSQEIAVPDGVDRSETRVIAWVQRPGPGAVLGASATAP